MIEELLQKIIKRTFELEQEYLDTHYFRTSEKEKVEYIAEHLKEEL